MTTLEQARALLGQLTQAAAAAQALVDALAPAAPPPPPPPPVARPELVAQRLDLANVVCLQAWHAASRYERFQRLLRLDGDSAKLTIIGINLANGGALQALRGRTYSIIIDGAVVGSASPAAGARELTIDADLRGLPAGWREVRIACLELLQPAESFPVFFGLRMNGVAAPAVATMPVCTNSYDVTQLTAGVHYYGWVRNGSPTPVAQPLPPREYPPVADLSTVRMQQLIPGGGRGSSYRPARAGNGWWTTATKQPYEWLDFLSATPNVPLLDGPRGIGACAYVTHIAIGTATQTADPASRPRRNIYCTDPWRVFRATDDGGITTLAGFRHRGGAGDYWRDRQDLELVGDWSAIPEERRGFHELWGLAWAPESLAVDTGAAPIPAEDSRQPHVTGPQCAVTDSQRNRVCLLTFPAASHGPAKITELIQASDPWDVVDWQGHWIVSERGADRVAQYDRAGRLVRVIVERDPRNVAAAETSPYLRVPKLVAGTLAMARLQPCLRPEGLALLGDWLYVGSRVQAMVQRVHLVTGERQTVALLPIEADANARYCKLAVSDGTFGPEGALWVHTWSNSRAAYSGYYAPGGLWVTAPQHDGRNLQGYGTAVAVGGGRLYLASMHEGIQRWSARQPGDPKAVDGILYQQGEAEWHALGLHLLYGQNGISPLGLPLPADLSPAMRRYVDVSLR